MVQSSFSGHLCRWDLNPLFFVEHLKNLFGLRVLS